MKFVKVLIVEKPLTDVITSFENPDKFVEWHEGFISKKDIANYTQTNNASSILQYEINGRPLEVEMNVISDNLPENFTAIYLIDGLSNKVSNKFETISDDSTSWTVTTEYSAKSLILKLIFKIRPKTFENITIKYMEKFKQMVESNQTFG